MRTARDVESVRVEMAAYVDRYRSRYEASKTEYATKESALQALDGSDPRRALPARREAMSAKQAMDNAKRDLDAATEYANKEIARAEREAEAALAQKEKDEAKRAKGDDKSTGAKVLDKAAVAAGVGVAATGAVLYVGAKGVKKVGEAGVRKAEESRIAMHNAGSHLAMSFAKYILGYDGSSLPTDPSRKHWDPSVKNAQKTGNTHDPVYQPSFV